ncbi:MAG: type II toxin-antitoxin system RelE/ParE family toxin [Rhodocyclaceae bacterium]|nr:type II toxin-antitoxin system RelE/ParE family toxin [Rhodocyclaceae bacterium]
MPELQKTKSHRRFATFARERQIFTGADRHLHKKRLNDNRHRSIILAKGGRYWVYEYLFAKKDRDNIADDELAAFRTLAKAYADLTDKQVERLLQDKDLTEICHDS